LVVTTGCFEAAESDGPQQAPGDDSQLQAVLADYDFETADNDLDGLTWHAPDTVDGEFLDGTGTWDDGFDPTAPRFQRFYVELHPDPMDPSGRVWIGTERNTIENSDGAVGCSIEWTMDGAHGSVPEAICDDCEMDLAMTCSNATAVDGGYCDRWYSPAYMAATQRWYADFQPEYVREDGVEVGTVWSRGTNERSKWREFVTGYRDGDTLYWDELKPL